VHLLATIRAIEMAVVRPALLCGDVNLLAMAASEIDGQFRHHHRDSMAPNQIVAQTIPGQRETEAGRTKKHAPRNKNVSELFVTNGVADSRCGGF
jgi:hypothetical protein